MELRVLQVEDKKSALALLREEWVKRTGASLREGLGGKEGVFLVVKAPQETIEKLLQTGVVEIPEDEEELIQIVREEEERSTAGVGLLGF